MSVLRGVVKLLRLFLCADGQVATLEGEDVKRCEGRRVPLESAIHRQQGTRVSFMASAPSVISASLHIAVRPFTLGLFHVPCVCVTAICRPSAGNIAPPRPQPFFTGSREDSVFLEPFQPIAVPTASPCWGLLLFVHRRVIRVPRCLLRLFSFHVEGFWIRARPRFALTLS